ncbi:MAG: undecaprenyl-diphosphate phosphatase [Candidatus Bathyarchaeia archaeon]
MRFEIILLSIIQCLTEWFPISSTGHLKLAEMIFGLRLPLLFDVTLHTGTLAVTMFFFRRDIEKILRALIKLDLSKSDEGIILQRIIIGTVFTSITGFIMMALEPLFHEIKMIGILFLLSGLITYLSKMKTPKKHYINFKEAAIIGSVQGFSILPGLSRSGLTISIALIFGVEPKEAFRFSFLLSIPAVLGGLIITSVTQYNILYKAGLELEDMFFGAFISALLGYFSLKILRKTLKHFHNFAFYPIFLSFLLLLLGGS